MQPLTLCEKQNGTLRAFSFFLPRHCLLERSTGHETVLRAGVCFVLTRKAVRTRAHLAAGRVANRILRVVARAAFRQGHVPIDAGSLPSERRPHHGGNVSLHFLALLMRGLANGVQRAEATSWAGARTWRAGPGRAAASPLFTVCDGFCVSGTVWRPWRTSTQKPTGSPVGERPS